MTFEINKIKVYPENEVYERIKTVLSNCLIKTLAFSEMKFCFIVPLSQLQPV